MLYFLGTLPYDIPVPPCRSLCTVVTEECASMVVEFGVEVPPEFNCDRFPTEDSGHPCIPVQVT